MVSWERWAIKTTWRCYGYPPAINSNWRERLTVIPRTNNLNISKYEMQELSTNPILVNETLGYPCQQYAGDSYKYAVALYKSCGYLEDAIDDLGNAYDLTKITCEDTVIFKDNNLSVTGGASSVSEPILENRRMDATSWGLSDPPAGLTTDIGFWNGVAFNGTNTCGKYSIYIPKSWLSGTLIRHLNTVDINDVFYSDGCIYFGGQDYWFINLAKYEFENHVYDPSIEDYHTRTFGGNALIAKSNMTNQNWIAGAVVAKSQQIETSTVTKTTTEINLPENTISRIIKLQIDEEDWRQVLNFEDASSSDKVFIISENKIIFGNGIRGYKYEHIKGNCDVYCLTDPKIDVMIHGDIRKRHIVQKCMLDRKWICKPSSDKVYDKIKELYALR